MINKGSETQTSWTGFLIFILIVVILFVWRSMQDDDFKEISITSKGTVYGMSYISHRVSGTKLQYSYKVYNNIYYGLSNIINASNERCEIFNNKSFPLLYNPSDPQESYLLVTQSDYDRFGLILPDSMAWVRNY